MKDKIETNKSSNHNFKYDLEVSLHEQKMLKTTEKYLTMLYLRYWCTENEKKEVLATMNENEKNYQGELNKKYNPDNLFKTEKNIHNN